MHFSSIRLLFVLSSATVIAGASVAERDYFPSHHSNQYEASKVWNNQEYPEWRSDRDGYDSRHENHGNRRYSDYHQGNENDNEDDQDYDIEHNDYNRGGNIYENHRDRYRNDSHHDKEDWNYDNEDNRKGRDRYRDNVPSGEDISGENGSSNSGSPAGGDGEVPSSQENVDLSAGNGTGETAGSKETAKPGSSPAGDGCTRHQS
ncbi:hypothetical protein K7432_017709 [Basidiobolus ranarum]|uniref:Uncharacterized protein n=1 Tax=Basidiobolus ranarum TaxID=34480 RepID=A0ABR2VKT3_9FUNG